MKVKGIGFLIFLLFLAVGFTGCTRVRTYTVDKPRVDQELTGVGNQGFLMGKASGLEAGQPRKLTRQTYVAEVELPTSLSKKHADVKKEKAQSTEAVQESPSQPIAEELITGDSSVAASEQSKVTSYTVQPNDTLQKISLKIFGTSKKWRNIFEANKDVLKTPDRIYAGQVMKIPQE